MDDRPVMLIVDDSEISRCLLEKACQSDYDILLAAGGREALDILVKNHVDIILLDIVMPGMSGYDVLHVLQEDENLRRIPVIVISVNGHSEAEEKALSLGADDYIAKPVPSGVIKRRIDNLLSKYVSERKRLEDEVTRYRTHDLMTGLPNAATFYVAATRALTADQSGEMVMIIIDIRRFKVINDLFGSRTGDELLIAIGRMLEEEISPAGPVCRLDGDRFAACVPGAWITQAWLNSLAIREIALKSVTLSVRFSVGLYRIDDLSLSPLQMCDRARMAVKSISGDFLRHYAWYKSDFLGDLLHEQHLLDDLDEALATGQFRVFYQPCYNPQTQQIISAEALVRWNHPERGYILPMDFIPQLENNGLISKVDREVWRQVCAGIAKRRAMGLPHVPISLNISRFDIYNPSIQEELLEFCQQYQMKPSELALEITERAYIHMLDEGNKTLTELQRIGFILEMDDFGVGNSSLGVLKSMPVDAIKLDMRFLTGYDPYKRGQGIIEGIVQMSKKIGVTLIAEGVENAAQLTFLRSVGCEGIQGFYFARPMPEEEFEQKLFEQREAIEKGLLTNPVRKRRMLLAASDASDRERMNDTFGALYKIIETTDGNETLDYLRTYGADILLLSADIPCGEEPGTGGERVMREMKNDALLCDVPVILLTSAVPDAREQKLAAMADDYIALGTNPQTARKRAENAVTNRLISREKQRSELLALQLKAEYDDGSGVYSRATVEQLINMEIRNIGANSALLLMRIDHYDRLRDEMPSERLSALPGEIAGVLRASLRDADVIGRLPDDTFVMFLFDVKTRMIAQRKAEELLKKISLLADGAPLSASIGIDMLSKAVVTFAESYGRAQTALKAACDAGGNCYRVYE